MQHEVITGLNYEYYLNRYEHSKKLNPFNPARTPRVYVIPMVKYQSNLLRDIYVRYFPNMTPIKRNWDWIFVSKYYAQQYKDILSDTIGLPTFTVTSSYKLIKTTKEAHNRIYGWRYAQLLQYEILYHTHSGCIDNHTHIYILANSISKIKRIPLYQMVLNHRKEYSIINAKDEITATTNNNAVKIRKNRLWKKFETYQKQIYKDPTLFFFVFNNQGELTTKP